MSSPIHPEPLEIALDEAKGLTMAFCRIPACPEGFRMGSRGFYSSEEPVHRVVIPTDFWMGETLVTQAQFSAWTGSGDYAAWLEQNRAKLYAADAHKNNFTHKSPALLPADNISWHEAVGYCEWLNEKGFPGRDRSADLPSEAHWEYACRAGSDTEYWNGDGAAALREVGWFKENAEGKTHPVKSKNKPNPFGLHDLHGNLWEWCGDPHDSHAYSTREDGWVAHRRDRGEVVDKDSARVLRGGSWFYSAAYCRSACRFRHWAGRRLWIIGFRVCLFPGSG